MTPSRTSRCFVGIDIAASTFVAIRVEAGQASTRPGAFDQTEDGFAAFQAQLPVGMTPAEILIAIKATGSYWIRLALTIHQAGSVVSCLIRNTSISLPRGSMANRCPGRACRAVGCHRAPTILDQGHIAGGQAILGQGRNHKQLAGGAKIDANRFAMEVTDRLNGQRGDKAVAARRLIDDRGDSQPGMGLDQVTRLPRVIAVASYLPVTKSLIIALVVSAWEPSCISRCPEGFAIAHYRTSCDRDHLRTSGR